MLTLPIVLLLLHAGQCSVRSGFDLYCDFEKSCPGWRNGTDKGSVDREWTLSSSVILDAWHSLPRPYQGERFAMAIAKGGDKGAKRMALVSDVIPCLLLPGYLTMYFWKNAFLSGFFRSHHPSLSVLIREENGTTKLVADMDPDNRWGWRFAAIEIPPSNHSFQLVIEAVVESSYDIVAIDEIVFRGYIDEKYCSLTPSAKEKMYGDRNLRKKQSSHPIGNRVHSTRNYQQESNKVESEEEGKKNVESPFGGTATRFLGSMMETLARTILPSVLSPNNGPVPQIPPPPNPPITELEREIEQERLQEVEPVLKITKTNETTKEEEGCKEVSCGFEGSSCRYEGTEGENGAWVIMQGTIGNPLTGISRAAFGLFYAVAYSSEGKSTQILRSPPFATTTPTYLTFWYYFASANSGRLVVCDRDLDNCLWEESRTNVTAESRKWRQGGVPLPTGHHQVLFVVEDLDEHYYAGLDHILLRRDGRDGPSASCSLDL